jgi:hypothetical protein
MGSYKGVQIPALRIKTTQPSPTLSKLVFVITTLLYLAFIILTTLA